jgi:general secretion pathway protein H
LRRGPGRPPAAGFTLIELLVVLSLIAIASAVAALALRDPAASQLDREAVRLSALLEAGRAESRASGVAVRFETVAAGGFRFVGTPAAQALPTQWLAPQTRAEIVGARALVLGPEAILPPSNLRLRLGDQQTLLVSDGLSPFGPPAAASAP